MKKIFSLALIVILAFTCVAHADLRVGMLTQSAVSEEDFNSSIIQQDFQWKKMKGDHTQKNIFVFYDSIPQLLLALQSNKIDEISIPEDVAKYLVAINPDYTITCERVTSGMDFVFGFMRNDKGFELQEKFNEAIARLKGNRKLEDLKEKYIRAENFDKLPPIKFSNFEGAPVVTIAVTGDIPPIDFVSPEGEAAGFNAALLAEIGRSLKINIKLVNITAGARTISLTSGEADVVFWYTVMSDSPTQSDIPEDVIISDPYHSCTSTLHVRKKN